MQFAGRHRLDRACRCRDDRAGRHLACAAAGRRRRQRHRDGKVEEQSFPGCLHPTARQHLHRDLHRVRTALPAASHPQKYSVNPNGWLRTRRSERAPATKGRLPMPHRTREEKLRRRPRPVHLVAKDGLDEAGLDRRRGLGEGKRIFRRGRPRAASCRARTGGRRARCSALGQAGPSAGTLAPARWPRSLPEGDWRFAVGARRPDALRRSASCSAPIAFTRYGKKPGKALRFALPEGADRGARSRALRRRLPGPRPHQHAGQRPRAGRARSRPRAPLPRSTRPSVSVIAATTFWQRISR